MKKKKGQVTSLGSRKPLALLVDDDSEFNAIMVHALKKLGLDAEAYTTASEFLKRLKTARPAICLIDLNIGQSGIGFSVIKAVRSVLGPELPLVVISSKSDGPSIAHSVELGANDYIIKPVDFEILASKLLNHVFSEELMHSSLPFFNVPDGGSPVQVDLSVEMVEVDEIGVKFKSKHLFAKGSMLELPQQWGLELSGVEKPLYMTVTNTWADPDSMSYLGFAEFDLLNEDLLRSIRKWLVKKYGEFASHKEPSL
jgi:DNA-binding response OmpR family regulator